MASRKRKRLATLDKIQRGNGSTHWADVESLLLALGSERHERQGSRVVFVLQGAVIQVHRVHGRRECGAGLVARVRAFLEKAGEL
jgi:hypothetical protein